MIPATADLCDAHGDAIRVVSPIFRDFGKVRAFAGPVVTVKAAEDNVVVRAALEQPGLGRVLVVDGGGSMRCALVGEQIALLAAQNGWSGLVIHGCVRDVGALAGVAVGIRALAPHPRKSGKKGWGERDVPVTFGGVTFAPGEWLCADEDGIVVASTPLAGTPPA